MRFVLHNIIQENVSICAITELWLKDDENDLTYKEVPPPGYTIISHPHKMGREGGVALVYKDYLDIKDKTGKASYFNMKLLKAKVNINSTSLALYVINQIPNTSVITFCEELAEALEWNITDNTKELVMIGDFNIHMDSRDNSDTITFNDFLERFRLENRVHFMTHILGHSLDLCITEKNNALIKDMTKGHLLSDHHFVHMALNIQRPFPPKKTISYWKLNRINERTFKHKMEKALSKFPKEGNLEQAVNYYNKALNDMM